MCLFFMVQSRCPFGLVDIVWETSFFSPVCGLQGCLCLNSARRCSLWDRCVAPVDDPDVSGAWGLTSSKFKFRQNISLGSQKPLDDKRFKPAVGDDSLVELSVRSFSVNTDRKI